MSELTALAGGLLIGYLLTEKGKKVPVYVSKTTQQVDFSQITSDLDQMLNLISPYYVAGGANCGIFVISLKTGGTFQQVFDVSKPVKTAIIQNISVEDVTLTTSSTGTAGQGIIINKASGAGSGGGTIPVNNVDLSKFYFVRTTAGLTLAIYCEW